MKLKTKVVLSTSVILALALTVLETLLLTIFFNQSMGQIRQQSLERYQLMKFSLQSSLLSQNTVSMERQLSNAFTQMQLFSAEQGNIAVYDAVSQQPVYSDFKSALDPEMIASLSNSMGTLQRILYQDGHWVVLHSGIVEQDGQQFLLISTQSADAIMRQLDEMIRLGQIIFLLILAVEILFVFLSCEILLKPIQKLTAYAVSIAQGNYQRRPMSVSGEIAVLKDSFDTMADAIQERFDALALAARQKEDFVSNFAHEMKTPLTSIVGYADMLCEKDLSTARVKEAAGYILREGLRLERLSGKLMELTNYERQEFILEPVELIALFDEIHETVALILKERSAELIIKSQPLSCLAERDLLKTLLFNLIDNALKAEAKNLILSAELRAEGVVLSLKDDGYGIEEEELGRITEAFYMVDKSRSRKENGAGLGLALAERIVQVHGGKMKIESCRNQGTMISITLQGGQRHD